MNLLQNKVAERLQDESVRMVIGYRKAADGRTVPAFIEQAEDAASLVFDDTCQNNLAVYLHKPEVIQAGKIGIVAFPKTLRSMVQLLAENQLGSIEWIAFTLNPDGNVVELTGAEELEAFVQAHFPVLKPEDEALLARLLAMSRPERWAFWKEQLSACVKCYACRAVCPLCYCSRCTVECNQPQWIKLAPTPTGNFEWHTMRAMHLAGRCIECGECGRICPVGIPVHLLSISMNREIEAEFGSKTGFSLKGEYALNTFRAEDKENFIR